MANRNVFRSYQGSVLPRADTRNHGGGWAYAMHPKHALAQYAATGCINATFYASAEAQLKEVIDLAFATDAGFVARTALFCRNRSFMKDMPAVLCAVLSLQDGELLERVFHRVMDDGRMLRNFVQVLRSGVVGRKSLGSRPRRLVRQWFERRSDEAVFRSCVGQSPSMADVIKMVHPRPTTPARDALFGYLLGKEKEGLECQLVAVFERFKKDPDGEVPDVPFQMLTGMDLLPRHWTAIARHASWQTTRMNLNTFARHGVFTDSGMVKHIANRLRDAEAIKKARAFPYQLMVAYQNASGSVPGQIREALQDAMELSLGNVPRIDGRVVVMPDVSGSMMSPATGYREGATTKVRCIDVAALMAAAILRKNPRATVLPFAEEVRSINLNAREGVMTNAQRLASLGGGGTNCSAPLALLNRHHEKVDVAVFVSDNQSWVDTRGSHAPTATMTEWQRIKQRCPNAKLVALDIQPYASTQAQERKDVLNVGGFSDQVFEAMAAFVEGSDSCHWVDTIEQVNL